jgi:hypothetical protein
LIDFDIYELTYATPHCLKIYWLLVQKTFVEKVFLYWSLFIMPLTFPNDLEGLKPEQALIVVIFRHTQQFSFI